MAAERSGKGKGNRLLSVRAHGHYQRRTRLIPVVLHLHLLRLTKRIEMQPDTLNEFIMQASPAAAPVRNAGGQ